MEEYTGMSSHFVCDEGHISEREDIPPSEAMECPKCGGRLQSSPAIDALCKKLHGRAEVERIPQERMYLHTSLGDGELDGRHFTVSMGIAGGLIVEFDNRPDEEDGLSEDRFIVEIGAVVKACGYLMREASVEKD